jgi:hypothetical protein
VHAVRLSPFAPALRLSDDERERAIRALRTDYAEGRLSTDELEDCVEQVYRSRTDRELDRHLGHLGHLGHLRHLHYLHRIPLRGARWLIAAKIRRVQRAILRTHALLYAGANGSLLAIWALTGHGIFWPAWLLVPSTLLLCWHAVASRRLTRALSRRGL